MGFCNVLGHIAFFFLALGCSTFLSRKFFWDLHPFYIMGVFLAFYFSFRRPKIPVKACIIVQRHYGLARLFREYTVISKHSWKKWYFYPFESPLKFKRFDSTSLSYELSRAEAEYNTTDCVYLDRPLRVEVSVFGTTAQITFKIKTPPTVHKMSPSHIETIVGLVSAEECDVLNPVAMMMETCLQDGWSKEKFCKEFSKLKQFALHDFNIVSPVPTPN